MSTMHTTAMLFMIIFGGHIIGRFIVLTDLTSSLIGAIDTLELSASALLVVFTLMYIVLGMILDIWAMLILTIPFVFPLIVAKGIDPVWFGIFVIMMCELAAITPPIGLNVYVMAKVAPEVPIGEIFLGIVPFFFTALAVIALLMAFPGLAVWLPGLAFR